jgi:nitrite reductase/ring-hydroxylating ferredoxin subunit
MGFFKRLFGICETQPPADQGCFEMKDGKLVVDLSRAPELDEKGGAIRLEGGALPRRVLVLRDDDGSFHAVENSCTHGGRRLDPRPGGGGVQCCSVGKSTFDLEGKKLSGSAEKPILVFDVEEADGRLLVRID